MAGHSEGEAFHKSYDNLITFNGIKSRRQKDYFT